MSEHYTRNTITATAFCKKCRGFTVHRVGTGRLGPCLTCVGAPLAGWITPVPQEAGQLGLFGGRAKETPAAPVAAPAPVAETKPPAIETAAADVAEDVTGGDEVEERRLCGTKAQELECAQIREFVEACKAAGFHYRGYDGEGGDRVYDYSRPGTPETVFLLRSSKWDHTPAMLEREAQRTERWL